VRASSTRSAQSLELLGRGLGETAGYVCGEWAEAPVELAQQDACATLSTAFFKPLLKALLKPLPHPLLHTLFEPTLDRKPFHAG